MTWLAAAVAYGGIAVLVALLLGAVIRAGRGPTPTPPRKEGDDERHA